MKVIPLHDRVLVKRLEEKETVKGGIIIPDTAKEKPQEAEVIAVGKGRVAEDGKAIPLQCLGPERLDHGLAPPLPAQEQPHERPDEQYPRDRRGNRVDPGVDERAGGPLPPSQQDQRANPHAQRQNPRLAGHGSVCNAAPYPAETPQACFKPFLRILHPVLARRPAR